nr:flavodoxin domain-containing protein [Treponema sp.]
MKVAVIYASTTGNTEAMANAIKDAVSAKGAEVIFATADSADKAAVTG